MTAWIAPVCLCGLLGFVLGFYRSRVQRLRSSLDAACKDVARLDDENRRLRARSQPLEVYPQGGGAYTSNRDCSADEFVAAVRKHWSDEKNTN